MSCRRVRAKRELVRVVRKPTGEVVIDPTGRVAGRGAYLCRNRQCWVAALERKQIQRALQVDLSPEDCARMQEYAGQLPKEDPEAISS